MLCALNNKSVAETLIFVAALVVFRLGLGLGHGAQTADTETAAAAAAEEDLEVGESQYVLRTSYPGGAAGAGAGAVVSTTVHHHQTYHTSGPPQYGKEPGYSVHFRKEYYDPRSTCSTHFGQSGTCKPLVSCTIHYTELVGALQTPCYLPDGMVGVCCQDQTPAPYAPNNDILLEVKGRKPIRFPKISPYELASAIKAGQKELEEVVWLERELFKKNVVVARETSASYHQKFFTTTPEALAMGFNANKNLETCKQLINSSRRLRFAAIQ